MLNISTFPVIVCHVAVFILSCVAFIDEYYKTAIFNDVDVATQVYNETQVLGDTKQRLAGRYLT